MLKGLAAFILAIGTLLAFMPTADTMITNMAAAGTIWNYLARVAMWGFFILMMVGMPILAVLEIASLWNIVKGACVFIIGTALTTAFLPALDTIIVGNMDAGSWWALASSGVLWATFLCIDVIIPFFIMIGNNTGLQLGGAKE